MSIKIKVSETDIRKQLVYYLRLKGWFVYHCFAGLGSYPGLSDLVAVKDGRVIHIEVKTPTGRQSEKQKLFQADIEDHGGEYLIIDQPIEDLEREGI